MSEFTPEFFDAASAAWMANKTRKPNCTVVYKCLYSYENKQQCGKKVYNHTKMVCYQHRNRETTKTTSILDGHPRTVETIKPMPR